MRPSAGPVCHRPPSLGGRPTYPEGLRGWRARRPIQAGRRRPLREDLSARTRGGLPLRGRRRSVRCRHFFNASDAPLRRRRGETLLQRATQISIPTTRSTCSGSRLICRARCPAVSGEEIRRVTAGGAYAKIHPAEDARLLRERTHVTNACIDPARLETREERDVLCAATRVCSRSSKRASHKYAPVRRRRRFS